jgi:hypothetical protein
MARAKRGPARVDPGGLFGCAGILVLAGAFVAFLAYGNHEHWLQRQEQIPRFQKVRATIREKGIAHDSSRDSKGNTKTVSTKWIHFTCHVGDRSEKDGARLTFSGSDAGWESYQQDGEYDAFFDPVGNECVLILDEQVGEPDYGLRSFLLITKLLGGTAAFMTIVGLVLRLRR